MSRKPKNEETQPSAPVAGEDGAGEAPEVPAGTDGVQEAQPDTPPVSDPAQAAADVEAAARELEEQEAEAAELYGKAKEERDGLTLVPSHKAKGNFTVTVVEPRIERNGIVVCKRK